MSVHTGQKVPAGATHKMRVFDPRDARLKTTLFFKAASDEEAQQVASHFAIDGIAVEVFHHPERPLFVLGVK